MDKAAVIAQLAPHLDRALIESLIEEFVSMERRFVLCDWEPATLDGGQFAEIAARAVYHVDSGNIGRRKAVNDCLKYVEDPSTSNAHSFPSRKTALHLCKVLRTIYKFRSQRGAVHIDPDYSANELDSTMIIANVRWVMAEMLRVFWTGPSSDIASIIREVVRFEVPAVLSVGNRQLVLRTDCTVEEEVLILLHNAGEQGMSREQLGSAVPKSTQAVTNALRRLMSPDKRQVVRGTDGSLLLTPLGSRRVREQLAPKLTLP